MWIALYAAAALACDPVLKLSGFDDWLENGTDIPTDARIVVRGLGSYTATVTRLYDGDVMKADEAGYLPGGRDVRILYEPRMTLEPHTAYQVDVGDPNGPFITTTFETGPGPTDGDVPPLDIVSVDQGDWYDVDVVCDGTVLGRAVAATVTIPGDLPPGTYVALRSDGLEREDSFDYLLPHDVAGEQRWSFVQNRYAPPAPHEVGDRDCLTPVLVLPSGDEVTGARVCMEARGAGCSVIGGEASGLWLVLAAVLARSRRRNAR